MADGDKLILGTDFNEENTTTELTKRVGFLPVLDLFNDNPSVMLKNLKFAFNRRP